LFLAISLVVTVCKFCFT